WLCQGGIEECLQLGKERVDRRQPVDLLAESLAILQTMSVPAGEGPYLVKRELLVFLGLQKIEMRSDQVAPVLERWQTGCFARQQVGRLSEDPGVEHGAAADHDRVAPRPAHHLDGALRGGDIA